MDRVLISLLLLAALCCEVQAEVSVPIGEIQGVLRVRELFEGLGRLDGLTYTGQLNKLCEGGSLNIRLDSIDVKPRSWFSEADGRFGIELPITVETFVNLKGNAWTCRYTGPLQCSGQFQWMGFLGGKRTPKGQCTSPTFRLLSFGLKLFEPPELFERGIDVELPECERTESSFSCVMWAENKESGGFVPSPERIRVARLSARLFGTGDVPLLSMGNHPQPAHNLIISAHSGDRADLSTRFATAGEAFKALELGTSNIDEGFAFKLQLDALDQIVDPSGNILDRGLLGQLLPIRIVGREKFPWIGDTEYTFIVSGIRFPRGIYNGKPVRILKLLTQNANVKRGEDERSMVLFRDFEIDAVIENIGLAENGELHPQIATVEVRLNRFLGLFNVRFSSVTLARQLAKVLNGLPLAKIKSEFDVAFPPCIAIEGDPSAQDLKACTAPGLLRHTSGIRGIRARLEQTTIRTVDLEDAIYLSGKLSLSRLNVGN